MGPTAGCERSAHLAELGGCRVAGTDRARVRDRQDGEQRQERRGGRHRSTHRGRRSNGAREFLRPDASERRRQLLRGWVRAAQGAPELHRRAIGIRDRKCRSARPNAGPIKTRTFQTFNIGRCDSRFVPSRLVRAPPRSSVAPTRAHDERHEAFLRARRRARLRQEAQTRGRRAAGVWDAARTRLVRDVERQLPPRTPSQGPRRERALRVRRGERPGRHLPPGDLAPRRGPHPVRARPTLRAARSRQSPVERASRRARPLLAPSRSIARRIPAPSRSIARLAPSSTTHDPPRLLARAAAGRSATTRSSTARTSA